MSLLLPPPVERDDLGAELPEPDLVPAEDSRFSDEQWRLADDLLDLPDVARDLSGLLAEARRLDPDLPRLVALLAVHADSPELAGAIRRGQARVLIAVPTGRRLDPAVTGGIGGDELVLTTAGVGGRSA